MQAFDVELTFQNPNRSYRNPHRVMVYRARIARAKNSVTAVTQLKRSLRREFPYLKKWSLVESKSGPAK